MGDKPIDEKTETASSAASNVGETNTASPSGTTATDKAQDTPSLSSLVGEALKANAGDEESQTSTEAETKEQDESEGQVQDLNKTEEEAEGKDTGETEDASDEKQEQDEKGPVPYERFHEVVEQKNDFETKVKEYEPIVESYRSIETYCQQNSIQPDQFQEALRIVAAINTDPAKAWEMLQPTIQALSGLVGNALPQDLSQEVEDGVLTEERAKEIAKLRAESALKEKRMQLSAEDAQKRQQVAFVQSVRTALESWEKAHRGPDFQQKKSEKDPDGAYEWFLDKMGRLLSTEQVRTPQDAIALAERAYAQVMNGAAKFIPKKPAVKSLTSTRSSITQPKEPSSVRDIVKSRFATESV